jgi:sulfotransferase family protein
VTTPFETSLQKASELLALNTQGPKHKPDLILISGAPRTGTSLAQMILCTAKGVNPYISEASPLYSLVKSASEIINHVNRYPKDYIKNTKEMDTLISKQFIMYLDAFSRTHNARTLVLKSPAISPFLPTLLQNSKKIICTLIMVRDPYQTLSSILKWRDKGIAAGQQTIFRDIPVSVLAKHIVRHYGFLLHLNLQDAKYFKICKFETLLSQPAETQNDWGDWTGLRGINYTGNSEVEAQTNIQSPPLSYTSLFGQEISDAPLSMLLHHEVLANKDELDGIFYTYCEAFGYKINAKTQGTFIPMDSLNRNLNQDLRVFSAVSQSTKRVAEKINESKTTLLHKAGNTKKIQETKYSDLLERHKLQKKQTTKTRKILEKNISNLKAVNLKLLGKQKTLDQKSTNKYTAVLQKLDAQKTLNKDARKILEGHKSEAKRMAEKNATMLKQLLDQKEVNKNTQRSLEAHKQEAKRVAEKYNDLLLKYKTQSKDLKDALGKIHKIKKQNTGKQVSKK